MAHMPLVFLSLSNRIDASEDDGSYRRLINDDHINPNLGVKMMKVDGSSIRRLHRGSNECTFFSRSNLGRGG